MTAALAIGPVETAEVAEATPISGSAGAILARVDELVTAVDALLGSDAMRSIGRLIQQLGIGDLISRCVAGLREIAKGLRSVVSGLRRATDEKDGLSGLIGLLRPLFAGLGALSQASTAKLDGVGLGALAPALAPVGEAMEKGERWLRDGQTLLARIPSATDVERLGGSVERLLRSLDELVAILRAPSGSGARPASSTGPKGSPTSSDAIPAQGPPTDGGGPGPAKSSARGPSSDASPPLSKGNKR